MLDNVSELQNQIAKLQKALYVARSALAEPVQNYAFEATEGSRTMLSELFGDRKDLIIIHNMGWECAYCTLWADGFNGVLPHLESRAAFVVVSPDDPKTQRDFAASRGWKFRMVSCGANTFAEDMGFVRQPEGYWPGVSAFRKNKDGTIVRTGRAEIGPGDNFCAVWHLFDLLADGTDGWEPRYLYQPGFRSSGGVHVA
jgi:predicted dithiol-disulfide oxidoreductase (DUF899 family)